MLWCNCKGESERAQLPCLNMLSNQHSPTWIYCHTTGHLASTQWGGGGKMFRGRQRSREGRRRQEDLLQTSKLHHSRHTQCMKNVRRVLPSAPCITWAFLSPGTVLVIHPQGRMYRSLTIALMYQASTYFPAKLGMCVPLSPFVSLCKKCLCDSLWYSCCELLIWHPDEYSSKPLPSTLHHNPFCQPCSARCWAPSCEVLSFLCISLGALFRVAQDHSLRCWQTKGEGVGGGMWLTKAWHLFGPVPASYCSATVCHYLGCLHIIFFSFCILTLAYSLFFLIIFNPWQQLLF